MTLILWSIILYSIVLQIANFVGNKELHEKSKKLAELAASFKKYQVTALVYKDLVEDCCDDCKSLFYECTECRVSDKFDELDKLDELEQD